MLPTNLIMMKGLDVLGCPTLRPYVSRVYPLADFKEAMRAKWSGEIIGGCALHP